MHTGDLKLLKRNHSA